nr:MORN repeat containing protein [Marseillevirus futianmevirus]
MNSLENLCFEKVKQLFASKKLKVEQFRVLPENVLERVCSFVPTQQQISAFGVCVRWMKGVLREKGFYINGKLEGQLLKWDEQGRVLEEVQYKEGKKDGVRVLFEPSKNRVYSIETYRRDLLHGERKTFREGFLHSREIYARGELHGERTVYFCDFEEKIWKKQSFYRGLKEGKFIEYGEDGTIRKEQLWVRDVLVGDAR